MGAGEITRFPHHPPQAGITLVEAMTTLAVASILATAAIPPMQDFVIRTRMSVEVNNFVASLYLARSEAVKRLQNVEVCPLTNCTGSKDYQAGWMVFADIDDSHDFSPGDVVLQTNAALPDRFSIGGTPPPHVIYDPTGKVTPDNYGVSNGIFTFCVEGNIAQARDVVVSAEGRVRTQLSTTTCTPSG